MSSNHFNTIRYIDSEGLESWLSSDIADLMADVADFLEYFVASQLEMIEDGIDVKSHIWSIGDDYILDRTACGYLLASCPDYHRSVKAGQAYFGCSQARKAKAIVGQIEANIKSGAI
jgi:hypothetical protein